MSKSGNPRRIGERKSLKTWGVAGVPKKKYLSRMKIVSRNIGIVSLVLLTACGQSRESLLTECQRLESIYSAYQDRCAFDEFPECAEGSEFRKWKEDAVRQSLVLGCKKEFPNEPFA